MFVRHDGSNDTFRAEGLGQLLVNASPSLPPCFHPLPNMRLITFKVEVEGSRVAPTLQRERSKNPVLNRREDGVGYVWGRILFRPSVRHFCLDISILIRLGMTGRNFFELRITTCKTEFSLARTSRNFRIQSKR